MNWTNQGGAGDNRWTVGSNWALSAQPTASDAARIAAGNSGSFSAIALRSGSGNTANVGTLQILRPAGMYSAIRADFDVISPGDATINFGNSAGIELDMSSGTFFTIGVDPVKGQDGLTTLVNNATAALNVSVRDGQQLALDAKMIGTGSLTLQRLGSLV